MLAFAVVLAQLLLGVSGSTDCDAKQNTRWDGQELPHTRTTKATWQECQQECFDNAACDIWNLWPGNSCVLATESATHTPHTHSGYVSGAGPGKGCGAAAADTTQGAEAPTPEAVITTTQGAEALSTGGVIATTPAAQAPTTEGVITTTQVARAPTTQAVITGAFTTEASAEPPATTEAATMEGTTINAATAETAGTAAVTTNAAATEAAATMEGTTINTATTAETTGTAAVTTNAAATEASTTQAATQAGTTEAGAEAATTTIAGTSQAPLGGGATTAEQGHSVEASSRTAAAAGTTNGGAGLPGTSLETPRPACSEIMRGKFWQSQILKQWEGVASAEDCQALCQAVPSAECQIWNWQRQTKSCGFYEDVNMEPYARPDFDSGARGGDVGTGCNPSTTTQPPCEAEILLGQFWQAQEVKRHQGVATAEDCQASCQAAPSTECEIWNWQRQEKSCGFYKDVNREPYVRPDFDSGARSVEGGDSGRNCSGAGSAAAPSGTAIAPESRGGDGTTVVPAAAGAQSTTAAAIAGATSVTRTSTATKTVTATKTATSTTTLAGAPSTSTASEGSPTDLSNFSQEEGSECLDDLWRDPGLNVSRRERRGVISVAIRVKVRVNVNVELPIEGTDASVTIPASALDGLGVSGEDLAAVVSVFDADPLSLLLAGAARRATRAAVHLDLATQRRGRLRVRNLREPILVSMPRVSNSEEVTCAYWDEEGSDWSTEGVEDRRGADGELSCATNHLSLFGAILKGFLKALECSQLTLLTKEGLGELLTDTWQGSPIAVAFWLVLIVIFACFALACRLDFQRRKSWTDECFLIPTVQPGEEMPAEEPKASEGAAAKILKLFKGTKGQGTGEEASLTDGSVKESRAKKLCNGALDKLHMMTLRKQTSASLWLSDQVVDYVVANPEFQLCLQSQRMRSENKAWCDLHNSVVACMKEQRGKHSGGVRVVPSVAARMFFQACPLVSVYLLCPFKTSSQRLLLLTCKFFGSLMVGAIFFQASGGFVDKRNPGECAPDGVGELIGRIILIGIASTLLAALPVFVLSKMHSRSIMRMDYKGSPKWKKQLRKWHIQDAVVWSLGVLYSSTCVFFILLFIANIHPNDMAPWGTSGLTSLLKDELVMPLAVSFLLPLLVVATLGLPGLASVVKRLADLEQSLQGNRISVHSV